MATCDDCPLCNTSRTFKVDVVAGIPGGILVLLDSPDIPTLEAYEVNQKDEALRLLLGTLRTYLPADVDKKIMLDYAIRCHVPKGSTIPAKAFHACKEHLADVVKTYNPSHIVVAGNTALRVATGKTGIQKKCNQTLEIEIGGITIPVIPVLSPGVVLRDLNAKARFVSTVKYAANVLCGKAISSVDESRIQVDASAQDISAFHKDAVTQNKIVAYDVEANTLHPYLDADFRMLSISVCNGQDTLVVPCDSLGVLEASRAGLASRVVAMLNLLKDDRVRKIAHNFKYDNHALHVRYGINVQNVVGDTLLMHRHLFSITGGHDLKTIAADLLGFADYSAELTPYIGAGNNSNLYAAIPYSILAKYNATDVIATHKLYMKMVVMLVRREAAFTAVTDRPLPINLSPQVSLQDVIMQPALSLFEVEQNGLFARRDYLIDLGEQLEDQKDVAFDTCAKDHQVIRRKLTAKINKVKLPDFNPNSDKQVGEIVFKGYGEVPEVLTKTGRPSVNAEVLKSITMQVDCCQPLIEFCNAVLAYRKAVKHQGTFVNGFLKSISPIDHRVHGSLNVYGTVTARLSSDNPNLQNVPRDATYRDIIGCEDGYALIEADYSQIELRILAAYSGDPRMLEVYRMGRDLHMETAMSIFPKQTIGKEMRTSAKTVNFGIAYGLTAKGLADQLTNLLGRSVSKEEARVFIDGFYSAYPRVLQWQQDVYAYAKKHGNVPTLFGTVRPLENARLAVSKSRRAHDKQLLYEEALRHAINTPIQGTAGLCTLLAIHELHRRFKATAGTSNNRRIVSTVHDSILVQVPVATLSSTLRDMHAAMVDYPPTLIPGSILCNVPLVVDFKVGKTWGAMTELNWKG